MKKTNYLFLTVTLLFITCSAFAQRAVFPPQVDRWAIQKNGSISWVIKDSLPHSDKIEMSGEKVSLGVNYEVTDKKKLKITRAVVFPTFRTIPNDTRGNISFRVEDNELPKFYADGKPLNFDNDGNASPDVKEINQFGIMKISEMLNSGVSLKIERSIFPSIKKPLAIEEFRITNAGKKPVTVAMDKLYREQTTDKQKSIPVPHTFIIQSAGEGQVVLQPGKSALFAVTYRATDDPTAKMEINPEEERRARAHRIEQIEQKLQLSTPDNVLNTAFAFAKIRATESIFKTKIGYLHSPGGLEYYAGIWANDQAEYVSPYFAFSGDSIGVLSAMNCYRVFARYMNPAYKPIPSSIVAEGDAFWNGAGDRGDQAMIAYGASRFALAYGNIDSAKALWPLISWCLEYCKRHLNDQGVVNSDSDELEGRFPSGKANLSTNSLYYDALISAGYLSAQLHLPDSVRKDFEQRAVQLRKNIEQYFSATINGFDTYKYYETNQKLRAWICMPLVMGIYDKKEGTMDALFSPKLWTADGLATEEGQNTFWDRSTLYALRGLLQAGETRQTMPYLEYYSRRRLLGEHVPYPVEAYPEGGQRHLSAESGLYCSIFTEGLFGIRPIALNGFLITPRLPQGWTQMSLKNIHSFGKVFHLKVMRAKAGKIDLLITQNGKQRKITINNGASAKIIL